MQRERQEIISSIAQRKQSDQQKSTKQLEDNRAYRSDLLGQIDYNRRQRGLQQDEHKRQEERMKEAELEHQRKIEHLLDKPVIQKVHPIRRGLYQSQSAGARFSYRGGSMNH